MHDGAFGGKVVVSMVRISVMSLTALGLVVVFCAEGSGQTSTRRSTANRSATTGGGTAASVTSSITQSVSGLSSAVPALQQSQSLRDTGTRGTFVGAEASDLPQIFGTTGGTTTRRSGQGLNIRNMQVRQPGMQAGRTSAYGRQTVKAIQPTLTLGFVPPAVSSADLQKSVSRAVLRAPLLSDYASVGVRVDGGSVILEGTVDSQHQRALISQLVALEPGVVKVDNRLTVMSSGRSPQ